MIRKQDYALGLIRNYITGVINSEYSKFDMNSDTERYRIIKHIYGALRVSDLTKEDIDFLNKTAAAHSAKVAVALDLLGLLYPENEGMACADKYGPCAIAMEFTFGTPGFSRNIKLSIQELYDLLPE